MTKNYSAIHDNTNGGYTIGNQYGFPIRVHNGYANFKNQKEANWAAEIANGAFEYGMIEKAKQIRECLNILEPSND